MMWDRVLFLVLLSTVYAWKAFEVPQRTATKGKLQDVSYFPASRTARISSDAGSSSSVIQALETLRASSPRDLRDLPFSVSPSALRFGEQESCVAVSRDITLTNTGNGLLTLEAVWTAHKEVKCELEKGGNWPLALHTGESVDLKVTFIPSSSGPFLSQINFSTSAGIGHYSISADVRSSQYLLRPLSLSAGDRQEVFMFNPGERPIQVVDVYLTSETDCVKVEKDQYMTQTWLLKSGSVQPLFRLSAAVHCPIGDFTVGISTSSQRFFVPITVTGKHKGWKVAPATVDFGIVTEAKMQYVAKVEISNFEDSPLEVSIRPNSLHISSSQFAVSVPALVRRFPLTDLTFSPRSDCSVSGYINVTASDGSSMLIPFRAFAVFNLLRYDYFSLVFNPLEDRQKTVEFTIDFMQSLRILAVNATNPGFTVAAIGDSGVISSGRSISFLLTLNASSALPVTSFLALETELGYIGLPLVVDDGLFTCELTLPQGKKLCDTKNAFSLGPIPPKETRHFIIRIKNDSYRSLRVVARWRSMQSLAVTSGLSSSNTKDSLVLEDGRPGSLTVVQKGQTLLLDCELQVSTVASGGQLQVTVDQKPLAFDVDWTNLHGEVSIYPREIRLERVFFGRQLTVPILIKHSFPVTLGINPSQSRIEGVQIVNWQTSVPANHLTKAWELVYPSVPSGRKQSYFDSPATQEEFRLWRERLRNNSAEVKGAIYLSTDAVQNIVVYFTANYEPPVLAQSVLDFGIVGIAEQRQRFIRVWNPGEESMLLQLLLKASPPKRCTGSSDITHLVRIDNSPSSHSANISQSSSEIVSLSSSALGTFTVRPNDSVLIGPIVMRGVQDGSYTLFLRNNLTFFEKVTISGVVGYSDVAVTGMYDNSGVFTPVVKTQRIAVILTPEVANFQHNFYAIVTKRFRLTNTGNKAVFIDDIALTGNYCQFRELEVLNCHEAHWLYPNSSFDVYITIRPSFTQQHWTEELCLMAGSEVFVLQVEVTLQEDYWLRKVVGRQQYSPLILFTLMAVAVGVLCSLLIEVRPRTVRLESFSFHEPLKVDPPVLSPIPPPCKKRSKRPRPKKPIALTLDLSDSQALSRDQTEATMSSKEEVNAWKEDEEQKEEKVESEEESFLDDYRVNSDFFLGFRMEEED